jgi:hypothetical protein
MTRAAEMKSAESRARPASWGTCPARRCKYLKSGGSDGTRTRCLRRDRPDDYSKNINVCSDNLATKKRFPSQPFRNAKLIHHSFGLCSSMISAYAASPTSAPRNPMNVIKT